MDVDVTKIRRESMRWYLLTSLNHGEPIGCGDVMLKSIMEEIFTPPVTATELHQQLAYLEKCELVIVDKKPDGHWHARLTAQGINVVEYASGCPEGVKRPPKYWV